MCTAHCNSSMPWHTMEKQVLLSPLSMTLVIDTSRRIITLHGYMIMVFIFIHTKHNCSIFMQQERGKVSAWMTMRLLPIGVQYWCSPPIGCNEMDLPLFNTAAQ